MLVNRKVWLGVTLIASGGMAFAAVGGSEGGEGGEAGAKAKQSQGGEAGEAGEGGEAGGNFPGGTFESALGKILAGEGGEGGIGLSKKGDTVSIPALDEAQVKQAIGGNTLRIEHHNAYYFDKSGKGEGWEIKYSKVDVAKCGKGADASYELEDGECWHSETVKLPASQWSVRGNKLCTVPAVGPVTGKSGCVSVFLILNNVGLFDGDKLVGKGKTLHKGRMLAASLAH